MYIVTRPRPEVLTIKFKDRTYQVTMDSDGAFVPADLGEYMCQRGLVGRGYNPDPKPQWERVPGGGHGALIPMFDPWCKEITPQSDLKENTS